METLDCIRTRRSIRKFLDIPVEDSKLGHILDAARFSPSAGNLQDWKFIVVRDEEERKKVAEVCSNQFWIGSAPLLLVVCSDPKKTSRFYGERGEKVFAMLTIGAVVQNMLLAIHDLGLSSCWIAAFDEFKLRTLLKIPESVFPAAVLPIGYPDEQPPVPTRYALAEMVFYDSWGNKLKNPPVHLPGFGAIAAKSGKEILKRVVRKVRK